MKMKSAVFAVAVLALAGGSPAFGVSKEIIQLQTQVQNLSDQITQMKQSFDERMGIMRNLVEQSTDNVNRMATSVDNLQKTVAQQTADTSGKVDQVSTQVQALHDSIDELKARLANVTKQLEDMRNTQQNLTPGAPGMPGGTAPPPDVLYNNALRDYNAGKYDLAAQEFNDYLKFYPTTDLAGNAQFYIGDIQYRQGDFQGSIQSFNKVLEQFPGGNKSAAAQLKKGYAMIELGQKDAGIRELNSLIQRYPRSVEATQARDRLRQLSTSRKPSAARR